MKTEFTQSEKRIMYNSGQYQFKAPPVCTAQWNIDDWMLTLVMTGDPVREN